WGVVTTWALAGILALVPWLVVQRSQPKERPAILEAPSTPRPDLALVVLDTVRRDRLALYGELDGGELATPALAALAKEGLRFDAAYSASPWSAPSHATLFTGKVPSRHGTTSDTLHLDEGQLTLAELLRRHGYRTVGLSGNPWVSDATGLTRGFNSWIDRGGEAGIASHFLLAKIIDATALIGGRDKGGRAIVRAMGEVLDGGDGDHPRFAFVNLSEPHAPYWRIPARARRAGGANGWSAQRASLRTLEAQHHGVTPAPDQREAALRSYDAAIAYADELLGELVGGLERDGHELCVVVVSDHGEMFGEHGVWGHGHGLYRQVLQVPMVLYCPGRVAAGETFDRSVSLTDIAPTLAALAGLDPAPLEADGVDLLPWIDGLATAPPHPHGVFAEHEIPEYLSRALNLQGHDEEAAALRIRRRAVILGPWRYEQTLAEDGGRGEHLFRLDTDPGEERDLAAAQTVVWSRAEAELRMDWWVDNAVGPWSASRSHHRADLPTDT
ncbi:MAG: sulfatase, partial [Myxococcota bacterium]|nr:sulfatase [Myxococcota bacterium]